MQTVENKPILVTGAHRSGTTWVGKILSSSPDVGYIDEPFSPSVRHYSPGTCQAKFDTWWMYITEENEAEHHQHIASTLRFEYHLLSQLSRIAKNRCGIRTFVRGYTSFWLNRHIYHPRPLMKDPIALFSTEWLARRFDMDVVIVVRHPAAFVSSIKRMNWPHDFKHFLGQPLLMRDHLYPFRDQLREFTEKDHDIIDESILLWNMFYHLVHKLQKTRKDFTVIRHEDLSRRPLEEFRALFRKLNIEMTDPVEKKILAHSSDSNPAEPRAGVIHQLRRNSAENVKNWQRRLSQSEIERVRDGVDDLAKVFYSDEDWQ